MPKTCIIGAGISGLALAWEIKRQGGDVTVFEQSEYVGGALRSIRQGEYIAEEGPNSILIKDARIEAFLDSIPGLNEKIVEVSDEAKKRFIVRHGKLYTVPIGPISAITTPLWSFGGKLHFLRKLFTGKSKIDTEESVADFARDRLGEELYQYAINPLVGGIYAGDPEQLSLRYGFPKLYHLEQKHGSLLRGAFAIIREARQNKDQPIQKRIISFKNGLGDFPKTIAEAIGDGIHTSVSITSIEKSSAGWKVSREGCENDYFDQLIVTAPAHQVKELPLEDDIRSQVSFLEDIEYPPVSVLTLAFKRTQIAHPLDGFGALVPECENRKILGVLFPSSLFAQRAPDDEALLTAFIGGVRQPEIATPDTDKLLKIVQNELRHLLAISGEPTFFHHKHWDKAIPQYKLGYGSIINQIEAFEKKNQGFHLLGNYRTGISVTDCVEAALNYTD